MRPLWETLGLQGSLFLVAMATSGNLQGEVKMSMPNILLVTIDDMGIADVGYNAGLSNRGAVYTPVIDRLAEESTTLTRFYTNAICTPSRATLMTGRFASRMNMKLPVSIDTHAQGLNLDEKLLSEVMRDLGYQTHMVGKWHLGHHERKFTPIARGFDSYCGQVGGSNDYFYHTYYPPFHTFPYSPHDLHCEYLGDGNTGGMRRRSAGAGAGAAKNLRGHGPESRGDGEDGDEDICETAAEKYFADDPTSVYAYEMDLRVPAEETTAPDAETYGEYYLTNIYGQRMVEIVESHDLAGGPLFLYASFCAVHSPLQALDIDFEGCGERIEDDERRVFCAMAKGLDRNMGYLVQAFRQKGIWEDTVVVFVSDNGGSYAHGGDAGDLRSEKGFYYDGGLRAPAFIRFGENTVPNVTRTRGALTSERIHIADLFTTIVGAASSGSGDLPDLPKEVDGRDLWPFLSDAVGFPDAVKEVNFNLAAGPGFMSSYTRSTTNSDGSYIESVIVTYEGVDYKLCRNCIGYEMDEIFDLDADPREENNLANDSDYAEVYEYLKSALATWVDVSFPELEYPTMVERCAELLEEAGLDPDLADKLMNGQRCSLPFDSPEFLCTNCSSLGLFYPETTPPQSVTLGVAQSS